MKISLATVSIRLKQSKSRPAETLANVFSARIAQFIPVETTAFSSEGSLLDAASRQPGRAAGVLILFDSGGKNLTSEEFAQLIARLRDNGAQRLIFAVGPADGWSKAALEQADHVISLGRMTLPHELARVVVAEQVYRAFTILAGHPYHSGH